MNRSYLIVMTVIMIVYACCQVLIIGIKIDREFELLREPFLYNITDKTHCIRLNYVLFNPLS